MTIEEIYKWAVKNECADKELVIDSDWHRFGIDDLGQLYIEDDKVMIREW